ncbi:MULTISPECIES: TRAP transporter small permease [Metabacillus]|uniref:C4-dicarboxylate ABC transporter n=2 Tax=Metabacillus TaxID=2675233 RepID=A0A179SP05_9BACI|nr:MULTISPECIES: TRAP transporter small permease [Metabacillus]OAS83425.1 C4-dicarboxylate ABC transporter [Metabacillus litoralis]QNF29683.1 TRAP transporter small permease [Metabacillus sp. KUDC1714]
MRNLKKSVDRIIEFLTCTLFVVMVAVASWQVLSRFILKSPSTFTEELLRYSLIWLAMLAAAYVVGKNQHIAITFLRDRLVENSKITLDILIQSIFLIFAAVIMVYGGGRAVSLTMAQISPALHLPMGFVYLALPLSGVFILFYSTTNIIELMNKKKKISYINEEKKAS